MNIQNVDFVNGWSDDGHNEGMKLQKMHSRKWFSLSE